MEVLSGLQAECVVRLKQSWKVNQLFSKRRRKINVFVI